ncbi:hypothetical protein K461DRAFT_290037 [Myriangium duriaei CBS 260.36]|uniref:Mediator of RNA polymerase II transcription subunit 16 n=1 Tax=Myriangium duriaei CBS 260.36 TaxID=1168546 RepID=A0A9P4MLY0_9PEZI|nr:hypothetical protein K461DRAFT_290037 [Myriangium duriaei CBS 260.36]
MPFMDHDMLDLFGEDSVKDGVGKFEDTDPKLDDELDKWKAPLGTSLPEAPQLFHRLDESYRSGCCQRLAWSKTGTISYISSDRRKIILRTTIRDSKTNAWVLTDDLIEPVKADEGVRFTHIQWSRLGLDLVALDQYGHYHIYTLVYALDRLRGQIALASQSQNVSTPIVGLHWLPIYPQQFRATHINPLVREGDDWIVKMSTTSADWPHHAIDGKTAFLSVAQSHILQIVYQQDGQPWATASTTLGDAAGCEDIITHAAFADASQFLYLATYSNRGCLRLYKVGIEWNSPPATDAARATLQAQLSAEGLAVIDHCQPQPKLDAYDRNLKDGIARSRLSRLSILSPSPSASSDVDAYQVLATFVHAGDGSSFGTSGANSCTSVVRWEIFQKEPELLDAFKNLKSSSAKAGTAEAITILERKEDWMTTRVVLGIDAIHSESTLALTYSDGSVEFRKREDLSPIIRDENDQSAGLPALSGFEFSNASSKVKFEASPSNGFTEVVTRQYGCSEVVLAPNACMAVLMNADGKLELKVMEYASGWDSHGIDQYQTQQALNSVAREVATMTLLQLSADEPLALIPSNLPLAHRRYLMRQICKILQRPMDFTAEDNRRYTSRALRDAIISKIGGLHLLLGYRDTPGQFDVTGKLSFITLNLRSIATSVAHTITPKEPIRADGIISLFPLIRWAIDLIIMILDDLARVQQWRQKRTSAFALNDLNDLNEFIYETESASLLTLLSATSRALVRMLLDLIKVYMNKTRQSICQSGAQRTLIQEIATYGVQLPFNTPKLESLLVETDNHVREVLTSSNLSTQQRVDAELSMLVDGRIPDCLFKSVDFLTGEATTRILASVDIGKITFWNFDWLGLRGSKTEDGRLQRRKYDVIRKLPIREDMKLKSCRRCGCLSEDCATGFAYKDRNAIPPWLMQAQRLCVCLGYWILEK